MDLYSFSLALGAVGLAAMAIGGLSHLSHGRLARHGHHGLARHGRGRAHSHHTHPSSAARAGQLLLSLLSPRVLFSLTLGFGATGLALRRLLGSPLLLLAAG